jgi:Eukaryotic aspartyl protease
LQHPDQPCTISGPVWEDKFSYGGDFTGRVPFGTITYQTPGFEQLEVIDGINGFACETTFFGHPTPFLQLAKEGKIKAKVSFCFGVGKDGSGFEGGGLTLGGFDPKFAKSAQEFTPLLQNELYVVNMTGVSVDGQSTGAPWQDYATGGWGGTVLDSGTNILLMPAKAYQALYNTFNQRYCGSGKANLKGLCGSFDDSFFGGKCFQMTKAEIAAYPPIELAMAGMKNPLVVPPESYILSGATNKTSDPYCFGVKNTGPGGFSIIGDTVMSGCVR